MQHIHARVLVAKTHASHVIVGNRRPFLGRQLVAFRQAQRVMPDRFLNVWAQPPHNSELARQRAGRRSGHVAADQRTGALAVTLEHVFESATKASAPANALHALHGSNSSSSSEACAPISAARKSASARATSVTSAAVASAPATAAALR